MNGLSVQVMLALDEPDSSTPGTHDYGVCVGNGGFNFHSPKQRPITNTSSRKDQVFGDL